MNLEPGTLNSQTATGSAPGYFDFVHTDPGTLAGRFMRMFWQPVYRSQDIQTGTAVPLTIMGETFTLYRGESGKMHLVAQTCAHRGTQLSVGWVEGDCIRGFITAGNTTVQVSASTAGGAKELCRKYSDRGLSYGRVSRPHFRLSRGRRSARAAAISEFEQQGVLEVETFVRPCNYFNDLDNACDPFHVTFVHGQSRIDINRFIDAAKLRAEETDFGLVIEVPRTIEGGSIRLNQYGMPNIQLLKLPPVDPAETEWRDFISWRVPVDDYNYVSSI